MTPNSYETWHQQLIDTAQSKHGISASELDGFAAHILEQQYYDERLNPADALEQLLQGYPPIS